ncbi:potassium/sodium hyperpolarization-activated cyclic nucleotide-gated channel 2-like isoform X2 [Plodia interpunctella]|nr:potassium/sodium hyperpolarization-activated cyclic nucleotide-gated channel 2-like isoform X2 [Plodia interpunctella]XP_053607950.1 potassium/sodium hyperpolarization-activated cyclic nucleotide-gated channel 2-like isoform X2 [Plodia interpunctella]XP_053607952.1 potassium/sodium hyperpolarization-activated cyclic nucleotide-gated channel 2-like isoform X2 [Plodia interpunctella]XP_053607953.1 potassium/sodium hyperpolarization-activated cyclic nucleotide-gated channel 2-like isoform X2 [Pl
MLHALILYKLHVFCMTSLIACTLPLIAYYLAILMELFMILDIFINTRTGYIDSVHRKVVLEEDMAFKHYCCTKLCFHVLSSIPVVFITFLRYGNNIECTICKANHFICMISFLTIFTTFRVYELSSYWNLKAVTTTKTTVCHFLRVGVIITLVVIQFVHYSDTVSLITLMNNPVNVSLSLLNYDFYHIMFIMKYTAESNNSDSFYMNAQFWRLVSFMSRPNYDTVWEDDGGDYKFSTVLPHPLAKFLKYTLLAICWYWVLVELYLYITQDKYYDSEICMKRDYLMNLVKTLQLPDSTSLKVKQYFGFEAAKLKLIEHKHGLYRALPKALKDEISWHCRRNLVRIPYFSNWPKEIIEKIVMLVKQRIYLREDMIAEVGAQSEGLVLVEAGVLAVFSAQHEEVGHLIDGDYFGELSLVTDREFRASSVVAASSCTVLLLEKYQFRMVMRDYPQLFYSLKEALKKEYRSKNTISPKLSKSKI